MEELPIERKPGVENHKPKHNLSDFKRKLLASNSAPPPKHWIIKPYLCINSYLSLAIFLVGFLIAYILLTYVGPFFPALSPLLLNLFLAYSLTFTYVCFTPPLLIRHTPSESFDPAELSDAWCLKCLTFKEENATHCEYTDCCSVNHRHHCSFLGVCIDGYKFYPFIFLGVCWLSFLAAGYYMAYKTIGMIHAVFENPKSNEATSAFEMYTSLAGVLNM